MFTPVQNSVQTSIPIHELANDLPKLSSKLRAGKRKGKQKIRSLRLTVMALRSFADDEWSASPLTGRRAMRRSTTRMQTRPDQSTYIRIFLSEAILSLAQARSTNAGECRAWRRIQLNSDKDNSPILCEGIAIDRLLPARVL